MRVGYHTDWASGFPFAQLGLPDNYVLALPALTDCGFEYDAVFAQSAGTRLYARVELAEQEVARSAAGLRMTVAEFRRMLRKRYRTRPAEAPSGSGEAAEGTALSR